MQQLSELSFNKWNKKLISIDDDGFKTNVYHFDNFFIVPYPKNKFHLAFESGIPYTTSTLINEICEIFYEEEIEQLSLIINKSKLECNNL